jgi:hypothetical protein
MEEFTQSELIVSSDELKELFKKEILKDTNKGWYYKDFEVEIAALHEIDSKYLNDVTKAQYYKLKKVDNLQYF